MELSKRNKDQSDAIQELYQALLLVKNTQEMEAFLKDLCTPAEIRAFAERWRVCKILNEDKLSYREINKETGASLATIGRIARFLKDEPHNGYRLILKRIYKK